MSITKPKSRRDFKKYIRTRLGEPVLEINVSDEQLDVAIDDAFQWFHERNHFNGVERVYLRFKITESFLTHYHSAKQTITPQLDSPEGSPSVISSGVADEIRVISAGSEYPTSTGGKKASKTNQPTITTAGTGSGLTINWGQNRTQAGGLTEASIYLGGSGYTLGDHVVASGGNNDCIIEVSKVKNSSSLYGTEVIETQRNFIIFPDDVIGVMGVTMRKGAAAGIGMMPGPCSNMPFSTIMGQFAGSGFDLVSYYAMQEFMATRQWLMMPPIQYNWNQRTHRLYLHTDNFNGVNEGDYLMVEAMVAPSPDLFPDLWNDMWLKQYATALVKYQWGINITKYNQVQLPGGITLNGEGIKNDAQQEIKELKDRFAMDWADPPLDICG